MKKIIIVLTVFFCGILYTNAQGTKQSLKLAHINTQELLAAMPASDSAQTRIQKEAKDMQETLEEMQVEFNTKYQDYLQNSSTYTDIKRQAKEAELQDLNVRIQQFQENAQQNLEQLRQKLLTPIIDKAKKAIEEVGRENGYTYVFDTSEGTTVVFISDNAEDILEKVKAKLGIQ